MTTETDDTLAILREWRRVLLEPIPPQVEFNIYHFGLRTECGTVTCAAGLALCAGVFPGLVPDWRDDFLRPYGMDWDEVPDLIGLPYELWSDIVSPEPGRVMTKDIMEGM